VFCAANVTLVSKSVLHQVSRSFRRFVDHSHWDSISSKKNEDFFSYLSATMLQPSYYIGDILADNKISVFLNDYENIAKMSRHSRAKILLILQIEIMLTCFHIIFIHYKHVLPSNHLLILPRPFNAWNSFESAFF
jgi:hypothetical protein